MTRSVRILATVVVGIGASIGILLSGAAGIANADHITFIDQNTFATFMDASQVVPGHAPGSIRAVAVCTDGLNGNTGAKSAFRAAAGDWNVAAGFQAFWLFGSGEFFGPCSGSEPMHALWTTDGGACSGVSWIGCNEGSWDGNHAFVADTVRLNSSYSYTSDGLRATATHELGHSFGLWEQYVEGSFACGPNTSIMESSTISGGLVVSNCGSTQTRPFDYNNVQAAFDKSFGATPQPQVLWIVPMSPTTVRLVFKSPNVTSRSYQRALCGGAYPVSQTPTAINNDVGVVDFPMPSSGTSVCVQWQVVGGAGSSGIHIGRLATPKGDVSAGWATTYSMSSQQSYMENNSGTAIPFTRITNNSNYANYPVCPLDAAINANTYRECNIESYGTGTVFWFSQDHSNYDAMNVP